jgi:hypothetical protein
MMPNDPESAISAVDNASEAISCLWCHSTIAKPKKGQKYCSQTCRNRHWMQQHRIMLYDKQGKYIGELRIK